MSLGGEVRQAEARQELQRRLEVHRQHGQVLADDTDGKVPVSEARRVWCVPRVEMGGILGGS